MNRYKQLFSRTACMGYLLFLSLIFMMISVLFPLYASYGGQWLSGYGRRDSDLAAGHYVHQFFPSTQLFPIDDLVYVAIIVGLIVWAIKKSLHNGKLYAFKAVYVLFFVLPFLWYGTEILIGFNYSNCRTPDSYTNCYDPSGATRNKLVDHAIIYAVGGSTLFWYGRTQAKIKG